MTEQQCTAINIDRLGRWGRRLSAVHATPVLLVGVGHDARSGQTSLCMTEELPLEHVLEFLRFAEIEVMRMLAAQSDFPP